MWKLMQADFRYNRIMNFCLYGVFFFFAFVNAIVGKMERQLSIIMLVLVWLAVMVSYEEIKNRKIRFLATLPVSTRVMGIYRIGAFVCWWLGMLLMLFLSTLVSRHDHIGLNYVWWLLALTGCIFLFVGFGTISVDLYYCVKDRKWGREIMNLIVSPLLTILLFAEYGLYIITFSGSRLSDIISPNGFIKAILASPWAIVLFLFGCGLLVLTVLAYERRMSYTDNATWPHK